MTELQTKSPNPKANKKKTPGTSKASTIQPIIPLSPSRKSQGATKSPFKLQNLQKIQQPTNLSPVK
jgi:hypothetical protein